jgi:4-amino-4-deoxy-L-arabinose transferase-like glycosyltransferase
MSASNALYLLIIPVLTWSINRYSRLIKWTEENLFFIQSGSLLFNGANIVGEQDDFFQNGLPNGTLWCEVPGGAISGDLPKEKAYRSLNWVTYCSDSNVWL